MLNFNFLFNSFLNFCLAGSHPVAETRVSSILAIDDCRRVRRVRIRAPDNFALAATAVSFSWLTCLKMLQECHRDRMERVASADRIHPGPTIITIHPTLSLLLSQPADKPACCFIYKKKKKKKTNKRTLP